MKKLALWLALLAVLGLAWLGLERTTTSGEAQQNGAGPPSSWIPAEHQLPGGISEEAIARLERWTRKVGVSETPSQMTPSRDIFRTAYEPVPLTPPPATVPQPGISAAVLPRLTGFVLERTQGGPVAAISYEGRMWLVEESDTMGPYRVEKLIAGEEVLLVEVESGEELLLTLN